MTIVLRLVAASASVTALALAMGPVDPVAAAKPAATSAPTASPAPLPTATPEPPQIAIPRLEAKVKADPNDRASLVDLAGDYLSINRPDEALATTQKLTALGVKTAQVYYLTGIAQESLGHIKEATDAFEQATNQDPTNAQILLTLTNLYLQTNRPADAERVAKRATTFNATDKRVFENYGLVLAQSGKFDDARTQFETAAKLDPKDPEAIVLEARTYAAQKLPAQASDAFDRALAIDPKSNDALVGKASLEASTQNVKGAIATYEQLLAVEPNDDAKAAVLITEYQVYRDNKYTTEAQATLKRALAAYPSIAAVHIANGDYLASTNDRAGAEAEWKTALGTNRDNVDALQRLAQLSFTENKKSDGVGYVKRITEVVPNDAAAWASYGDVLAQSGKIPDAREAFKRSFGLSRTPQALVGIGTADLQLRNYKECSQIFAALDRAPDIMKRAPQLLYAYGQCAAGSGDKSTARSAYTRFKAYVKPGTQLSKDVDRAIAALGPVKSANASKPVKH